MPREGSGIQGPGDGAGGKAPSDSGAGYDGPGGEGPTGSGASLIGTKESACAYFNLGPKAGARRRLGAAIPIGLR